MKNNKELFKNSLIIFLGKGCTQFIVFLLLPLYTAFLSVEEYGTMDLITTYVTLLAPLISLQLENAIFRYLIDNRKNDDEIKNYISSGTYCLIWLIIIGIIIVYIISLLFQIKYGIYLAVLIAITMLSNYILSICRGIGNNIEYAKGSIIAGVTSLILNLIFLIVFKMGIPGIFISQIISNLLCSIYCIIKNKILQIYSSKSVHKDYVKKLLKYSLPLVPNSINWWIINASDKTIVSIILGTSSNGIYSVSNKFSAAFIAIYNIFNLSWTESASLHINDEDKDEFFSNTFNTIYKLFYSFAILIIVVMPFVFNILISNAFIEAYKYIPFLLLGSLLNVIVGLLSAIYIAKKLTKEVAFTSLIAAIVNIATNFLLIKKFKIWAAVLSTIIAFGVMTIYRIIDIKKYVKLKIDFKFIVLSLAIYILVSIIYIINNTMLNLINLIICAFVIIFMNKNIIISLKNIIKKKSINAKL